ncbi:MAG: FtsX-like permease family protein, partial [Bacteroidota bacterium]
QSQPLGFRQDQMLSIPIDNATNFNAAFRGGDANIRKKMNTFDDLLLQNPHVEAVTQCARVPGTGAIRRMVATEKVSKEEAFTVACMEVDYDYAETFDLEVLAGREFDLSYGTDHIDSYVLNEEAVTALGWESPEAAIGQSITVSEQTGKVVGVVKNYHFSSLYNEINPLILYVQPGNFAYFIVHLSGNDIPGTLAFIEEQWQSYYPSKAFTYSFVDESFNESYAADQRLMQTILYFALIAVLISCFGLFGLAALFTQQRFKEIGIRKVLGASVGQILRMLSSDFIGLIAVAMLLAFPIIWYFSHTWMANFAFHIHFPWWVPLSIGFGVMLLAFLTISSKTIRAALSNPVEAIRHE